MYEPHLRDTLDLPMTYRRLLTVDFKKDRKVAVVIQGIFLAVALIAVAVALVVELPLPGWSPWITVPVTLVACLIYMSAHELTHGITLRALTGTKPSYAVRFPLLTTSSPLYLTRRSTIMTALSPCIFWGVVFLAALFLVPEDFVLTIYILLVLNFAGSAGDYVETVVAFRQPTEALLHDEGDRVHVFVPEPTQHR